MTTNAGNTLVLGIILGVVLTVCVAASVDTPGRGKYGAIRLGHENEFLIIDTESGHAWRRSGGQLFDLGTPEAPRLDITTVPRK